MTNVSVIQGQRLHTVQANPQSADHLIRIKQKRRRVILNTVTRTAVTPFEPLLERS